MTLPSIASDLHLACRSGTPDCAVLPLPELSAWANVQHAFVFEQIQPVPLCDQSCSARMELISDVSDSFRAARSLQVGLWCHLV